MFLKKQSDFSFKKRLKVYKNALHTYDSIYLHSKTKITT